MPRLLRHDRAATDPILVIAAIAVSLVLLVGGSFAVSGAVDRGHDFNAKQDLSRVAVAETALLGHETTHAWEGAVNASRSTESVDGVTNSVNRVTHPWNDGSYNWTFGFGNGSGTTSVKADDRFPGGTVVEQSWSATSSITTSVFAAAADSIAVEANRRYVIGATVAATSWDGIRPSLYMGSGSWVDPVHVEDRGDGAQFIWRTWVAPEGTEKQHPTVAVEGPGSGGKPPQVGSAWRVSGAIFIDADAWTGYFDGASKPQLGAQPYISDSGATILSSLSRDASGVPAQRLQRLTPGFTPSDGVELAVVTTAEGSGWVAVAKSRTGREYLRSSSSTTTTELLIAGSSRTLGTPQALPPGLNLSAINSALDSAGRF